MLPAAPVVNNANAPQSPGNGGAVRSPGGGGKSRAQPYAGRRNSPPGKPKFDNSALCCLAPHPDNSALSALYVRVQESNLTKVNFLKANGGWVRGSFLAGYEWNRPFKWTNFNPGAGQQNIMTGEVNSPIHWGEGLYQYCVGAGGHWKAVISRKHGEPPLLAHALPLRACASRRLRPPDLNPSHACTGEKMVADLRASPIFQGLPNLQVPDGLSHAKNTINIYVINQDDPETAFNVFKGEADFGMSAPLRHKYQAERCQLATQAFAFDWCSATQPGRTIDIEAARAWLLEEWGIIVVGAFSTQLV